MLASFARSALHAARPVARAAAPALARRLCSTPAAEPTTNTGRNVMLLGSGAAACAGLQWFFGSAEDFFDHRFVTTKKPDDLADFYGTEDFMQLYCVFPFMERLMMRGSYFDDDGVVHTYGISGDMLVAMEFSDREANDGTTAHFNKRERFTDKAPWGVGLWWDMVQNFGFTQRKDGKCEVYHHGEYFYGPWPVRVVFYLHGLYLIWATERHINSAAFGNEEAAEEAHAMRSNIPAHVFAEWLSTMQTDVEQSMATAGVERKAAGEKVLAGLKKAKTLNQRASVEMTTTKRLQRTSSQLQLIVDDKELQDVIRSGMDFLVEVAPSGSAAPGAATDVGGSRLARRASQLDNLLNHPQVRPQEDAATPKKAGWFW